MKPPLSTLLVAMAGGLVLALIFNFPIGAVMVESSRDVQRLLGAELTPVSELRADSAVFLPWVFLGGFVVTFGFLLDTGRARSG